jgi:predicted MFS family arabinose efflux permease
MEQRSVSYGWVVVAAAATITCVGIGTLFSLGVFLVPIERAMGWSRGAVFLLSSLGMGIGSLAGGVIYDRLGAYAWLYLGSALVAFMAVVLAFTFRRPATLPGRISAAVATS